MGASRAPKVAKARVRIRTVGKNNPRVEWAPTMFVPQRQSSMSPPKMSAYGGSPPRRSTYDGTSPTSGVYGSAQPSHRAAPSLALSKSESYLRATSFTQLRDIRRQRSFVTRSPPPKLSHQFSSSPSFRRSSSTSLAVSDSPPRDDVVALIDAVTHQGKHTALRIAREESIRQLDPATGGADWTSAHVRRFQYRPDENEFTSRALNVLMEQALLSHQRRVDEALSAAARARSHSSDAENTCAERIEDTLQMAVRDPNAQHALRQAMRAYASRADKEANKLREALYALENETALAQSSYMVCHSV